MIKDKDLPEFRSHLPSLTALARSKPRTSKLVVAFTRIALSLLLLVQSTPAPLVASSNSLVTSAATAANAETQTTKPAPKLKALPAVSRSLYAGLWRIDGGFVSTLQIKNKLITKSVDVSPVLYFADGEKLELPSVHLSAAGTANISINQALTRLSSQGSAALLSHASTHGSAALSFTEVLPAVSGYISVVNASSSLSYVSPFEALMEGASSPQTLEGLWWRHDDGVGGFVNLSNSTLSPVRVGVQPVSATGKESALQSFTLAPHESKLLDLNDLLNGLEDSNSGGLRVTFPGHIGDVNVMGGLENLGEGYSASMPFWLAPAATGSSAPKQIAISHPGLIVGLPDPAMNFPAGTKFTPYLVLRNTQPQEIRVQLMLYLANGEQHAGPVEVLKPLQSKQVNMKNVLKSAGLRDLNGMLTLELTHVGQSTDVLEAAGSVDNTGTYVLGGAGRISENSASKSVSYWSAKDGLDTMVSLWNSGSTAEDLVSNVYFSDGSGPYQFPVHLEPHATSTFNISELLKQKQDSTGKPLPVGIREGSLVFGSSKALSAPMNLGISIGLINVATATCYEGCIECSGYDSITVSPNPLYCPFGDSHQMTANATYEDGSISNVNGNTTWTSDNGSIATVNSSGVMSGSGVGSANLTASAILPHFNSSFCEYNPTCNDNPAQTFQATTQVIVAPIINSITPATVGVGRTSASIVVLGSGFGPSPSVQINGVSGISVSNASNTTITVSFSTQQSVPGTTTVTVASNGQSSNGVSLTLACALPVNFTLSAPSCNPQTGTLGYTISWSSSTGNQSDLATCRVGETVTYPNNGVPDSPPFPTFTFVNPTLLYGPGTSAASTDNQSPPTGQFVKPYRNDSFTGTQSYRWQCGCAGQDYTSFTGYDQFPITRQISNVNGTWKYTVTKLGASCSVPISPQ